MRVNFFHETVNSYNLDTVNQNAHVIFVLVLNFSTSN